MDRSLVCLLAGMVFVAVAVVKADAPKPAPGAGACVQVETETRYRNYGYDHIVVLRSACKRAASCTVKTDANPEPQTVEVAVGETKRVQTFSGSPARTFRADVSCKEHD
jgi:hypothetical protein